MAKKTKKKKIRVPKGPCDREPPRHPPDPTPSRPWDKVSGPDPLEWLRLGKRG